MQPIATALRDVFQFTVQALVPEHEHAGRPLKELEKLVWLQTGATVHQGVPARLRSELWRTHVQRSERATHAMQRYNSLLEQVRTGPH
jgi:hypothetical protein